jgi:putative ABC transport system substrate-binding protein
VKAGSPLEIDAAFATLADLHAEGLMLSVDPFFYNRVDQIVALAARYRIPTIYDHRRYIAAGGLISFGYKVGEGPHTAGVYLGRILAGAKPADLPIQMPTRFELMINRKTANVLGLTVPLMLETQADEIIE